MRQGPIVFLGVFVALALSWTGMIVGPQLQLGREGQVEAGPGAVRYPAVRPGLAQQGADVYRANGCYYCHTQQVQPVGVGADLARNWGARFSVAQDYLADHPVMLGTIRVGPDLANVGMRVPSTFSDAANMSVGTNTLPALKDWHLIHLYNPRITSPKSNMPRYPYLFEERKRKASGREAEGALKLPEAFKPKAKTAEEVIDVVPKREAVVLVEYLMSLKADLPLFESPIPMAAPAGGQTNISTNKVATNAPAGPDASKTAAQPAPNR